MKFDNQFDNEMQMLLLREGERGDNERETMKYAARFCPEQGPALWHLTMPLSFAHSNLLFSDF
jgi:hypothetical protein